jgi:hypothetical protein
MLGCARPGRIRAVDGYCITQISCRSHIVSGQASSVSYNAIDLSAKTMSP